MFIKNQIILLVVAIFVIMAFAQTNSATGCQTVCPEDYQPVCGSNGQTYA